MDPEINHLSTEAEQKSPNTTLNGKDEFDEMNDIENVSKVGTTTSVPAPTEDQTKDTSTTPPTPVLSGPTSPISPVPPLTTQPSPTPTIPSFDIPSIRKGLHSLLAETKAQTQPNPINTTLDVDEEEPVALTENEVGINELIEKTNEILITAQGKLDTIRPITSEMSKTEKEGILNAITSLIEKELTEIAILTDSVAKEKRVTALIELKHSIHNLLNKESIKLNDALIEVAKASAKDEKKASRFDSLTQHFWSQPYKVSKGKLGENEYSHTCNNLNGGARSLIEAYLRDKGRPKGNRLKIIVNKSPNATSYSKQEKEFMGSAIDNSLLYALKPPRLVGIQSDNKEADITPREMGQDIHMKLYIAGFHFNEDGSQKDLGVLQRIIALRVLEREHEELAARYTLAQTPSSKAGTSKPLAAIGSADESTNSLAPHPSVNAKNPLSVAVESIAGKAAVELLKFDHMSVEVKKEFEEVKDMITTGYLESFKGTNMDADEIMDMLSESTRIKNMETASRSNLRDYLSHIITNGGANPTSASGAPPNLLADVKKRLEVLLIDEKLSASMLHRSDIVNQDPSFLRLQGIEKPQDYKHKIPPDTASVAVPLQEHLTRNSQGTPNTNSIGHVLAEQNPKLRRPEPIAPSAQHLGMGS